MGVREQDESEGSDIIERAAVVGMNSCVVELSFKNDGPQIQARSRSDCEAKCECSEQPLAMGEGPGQTDTNCEHVNVNDCLNCHIFLASPGLFLDVV